MALYEPGNTRCMRTKGRLTPSAPPTQGPLGWLIPSEIQPLETRSAGQGIAVAVNFIFTFAMGQAFLSMLCGLQWGIFLLFACFCLLMTGFVWVFLPETKGVPIEEMRLLWRRHPVWRRILGAHLAAGAAAPAPAADAGPKGAAEQRPSPSDALSVGSEDGAKPWKPAV